MERKATVFYEGDGVTTVFPFSFLVLQKKFVKVAIGDTELTYGVDYTIDTSQVVLTEAPAEGAMVKVYRQTPTTQEVEWADGSVLKAYDLTKFQIQLLHVAEETADQLISGHITTTTEGDVWDGLLRRLANLADPVEPQDAVTLAYMQSTQNGYIQDVTNLKNQASQYADNAKASAQSATASALSASTSEQRASTYLDTIKNYATATSNNATKAKTSEDNAQKYAEEAKYVSENVNIFTPYYDDEGNLCFTNKVGLENPAPRPIRMIIKGKFDTEEELVATYPVGEIGDYYTANNHLYTWYGDTWVNVGSLVANNTTPLVHIVSERERTENEPTYGLENGIIELEQATFLVDVDGTLHEVESKNIYLKETDT